MMAWQLPASSKPRWRSESMSSPSADLRLNPLYVMNGTSHKPPGLAAPVLYLSSQETSDSSISHWPSAVQPRPSHVSTRVGVSGWVKRTVVTVEGAELVPRGSSRATKYQLRRRGLQRAQVRGADPRVSRARGTANGAP